MCSTKSRSLNRVPYRSDDVTPPRDSDIIIPAGGRNACAPRAFVFVWPERENTHRACRVPLPEALQMCRGYAVSTFEYLYSNGSGSGKSESREEGFYDNTPPHVSDGFKTDSTPSVPHSFFCCCWSELFMWMLL